MMGMLEESIRILRDNYSPLAASVIGPAISNTHHEVTSLKITPCAPCWFTYITSKRRQMLHNLLVSTHFWHSPERFYNFIAKLIGADHLHVTAGF